MDADDTGGSGPTLAIVRDCTGVRLDNELARLVWARLVLAR